MAALKDEENPGDYQGANFIRFNKMDNELKDIEYSEWEKIPVCCRYVMFGRDYERKMQQI